MLIVKRDLANQFDLLITAYHRPNNHLMICHRNIPKIVLATGYIAESTNGCTNAGTVGVISEATWPTQSNQADFTDWNTHPVDAIHPS